MALFTILIRTNGTVKDVLKDGHSYKLPSSGGKGEREEDVGRKGPRRQTSRGLQVEQKSRAVWGLDMRQDWGTTLLLVELPRAE